MLTLCGVGHSYPKNIIDNHFLESLDIGTSNEWIMERVGIETRRTVLPLDYIRQTRNSNLKAAAEAAEYTLTDLAETAALMAVERAGIGADQIGLVIAGVSVPQMYIPANACLIAERLGITAPAFDLNSACSTFAAQLHFLNGMNFTKMVDYVLLIQPETYTMVTDYNDRNTAVLWGDGASAQVLSPHPIGKAKIVGSLFESDPSGYNFVRIPVNQHFSQEGSRVQKFAITETVNTFKKLKAESNFSSAPYFIGHQANLRMLESSCKRMEVTPNKHFYNINRFGNRGAAGAPSVLSENWETFQSGDHLIIATVGSGLSWGGSSLSF